MAKNRLTKQDYPLTTHFELLQAHCWLRNYIADAEDGEFPDMGRLFMAYRHLEAAIRHVEGRRQAGDDTSSSAAYKKAYAKALADEFKNPTL